MGYGIGPSRNLGRRGRVRGLGAACAALLASSSVTVLAAINPAIAQTRAESIEFNIPAQRVDHALLEYARQAGVRFVASGRVVGEQRANAVQGVYDRDQALSQLLRGTGVEARLEGNAIRLVLPGGERHGAAPGGSDVQLAELNARQSIASDANPSAPASPARASGEDDIVVVGTNIRGVYPSPSPVDIYTAEDIERMGVTTTQGFVERLPQNFGTRTQYATNSTSDTSRSNFDTVSSVDLRGLGVGTTLTLLNGRRLSGSDFGQAVDVSMIPVGAISRVEVLTDGASAIYGSDAIGGVVNFVLRDDFEGAETQLSYGGVTDGHLRQGNASQTFGEAWSSGYAVASYNYYSASALEREDRDYASGSDGGTLTPHEVTQSVLVTGAQDLTSDLVLSADLGFARRNIKTERTGFAGNPLFDQFQTYRSESDRGFLNLALDYQITDALNATLQASYSRNDSSSTMTALSFNQVPQTSVVFDLGARSSVLDITGSLDGALFDAPGGAVRFSIGGGALEEEFSSLTTSAGFPSGREISRRTTYAFGEIFAPIVGDEQSIPFIRRLELSLAGRYTSYDDTSDPSIEQDFGDAFDPKVGLMWSPFLGLNMRATYGTSFRAPSLAQLDPSGAARYVFPNFIDGSLATELTVSGYADTLRPETAETYTAGFDISPPVLPNVRISGTYYRIEYTDRIGVAPTGGINPYTNPELLPDFIYRPSSAAEIEAILGGAPPILFGVSLPGVDLNDPAAVAAALFDDPNFWITDGRYANLALSEQDGVDLSVSANFDTSWGDLSVGANATRILSYRQQGSPSSPVLSAVGYVGLPTEFRARAFVSAHRGGANASINVNYAGETKLRLPSGGSTAIDSWTTTDLSLSYDFTDGGALEGLRLSLSAANVFDVDPPRVPAQLGVDPIGFDTTNANPLGRVLVFGLTKRW